MVRVLLQSNIGIQVGNFDTFGCSGTVELEVVECTSNIITSMMAVIPTHRRIAQKGQLIIKELLEEQRNN
jgi:hypothetical protein